MIRQTFCVVLLLKLTYSLLSPPVPLLSRLKVSAKECDIATSERENCGFPAYSRDECEQSECCWSSDSDSPTCYHSKQSVSNKRCVVAAAKDRVKCGRKGIRKEQCLAKDCCWQPSKDGPWCYEEYYPPVYTGSCGKPAISPNTHHNHGRVIGGDEAIPHSWPWSVSLQLYNGHVCGGSILNERWILSAAHCMFAFDVLEPESLVVVGAHNATAFESTSNRIMMDRLISHEGYRKGESDILLIRVKEPIKFNDYVSPVCLSQRQPVGGDRCYSTGWGLDDFQITEDYGYIYNIPDELQQFMSPVVDKNLCNSTEYYDGMIHPTYMCAGWEEGGRGNCYGDSGGPLVCLGGGEWRQVGVVSWGMPCALPRFPTVYADVALHYNWIRKQIAINSD